MVQDFLTNRKAYLSKTKANGITFDTLTKTAQLGNNNW